MNRAWRDNLIERVLSGFLFQFTVLLQKRIQNQFLYSYSGINVTTLKAVDVYSLAMCLCHVLKWKTCRLRLCCRSYNKTLTISKKPFFSFQKLINIRNMSPSNKSFFLAPPSIHSPHLSTNLLFFLFSILDYHRQHIFFPSSIGTGCWTDKVYFRSSWSFYSLFNSTDA